MIIHNDCTKAMAEMDANSVDAVVTDAPYGLKFMGRNWDKGVPGIPYWNEAYRVLKPGGSMLVMGGTRTFHRLMVAIEDSGFIIKDTIMYLYGSGFPKAQDLGKMIDKRMGAERKTAGLKVRADGTVRPNQENWQPMKGEWGDNSGFDMRKAGKNTAPSTDLAKHWDGFKVGGIKPAYEPIVWAVKPPDGSYIDNVLKWGVGAVNVDECRVGTSDKYNYKKCGGSSFGVGKGIDGTRDNGKESHSKGRFPANVILDEEAGRMLDEQSGNRKTSGQSTKGKMRGNGMFGQIPDGEHYGDSGGVSRFFYTAKASKSERNAGLEGMGDKKQTVRWKGAEGDDWNNIEMTSKNNHPTVKPIALFKYLIKLVTRKGQIVLDPFMGSGTTGCACVEVEREFIGIEKEDKYIEIATKRIEHWEGKEKQHELFP